MDPAVKQRLLRHLDSCVSELDLDLGSRPDSGLGSSPGSVTDRVVGATSPGPMDHHVPVGPHCSAAALTPAGLIKSEIPDIVEAARPDSSTTAGDENNNSSRPTSAFSQVNSATLDSHHPHHPTGIPVDQASTSQQNPNNMLSVVQVIPSRLPDGQVVFLLPSHYVQLAAAAAANGISIGPNPPTAIWAATNMSLLKATDKLAKRPHDDISQDWQDSTGGLKPSKSPRMEQPEQPLDFTTTSKKMKIASSRSSTAHSGGDHHHLRQQQISARLPTESAGGSIVHEDRSSSHADSEIAVGISSPSPVGQQPVKDEEGMWRPW
ncbi:hypothetical protein EAG_04501 [Camponotus floridanus]|uniref:Orange domain-containing protein n=2 Tax=Camponotus floridanus TaxID=104421 RepID=E2ANW3_CAMFO|nr:hypothetical protein EAG_04501 [Camponotus floridanus]